MDRARWALWKIIVVMTAVSGAMLACQAVGCTDQATAALGDGLSVLLGITVGIDLGRDES